MANPAVAIAAFHTGFTAIGALPVLVGAGGLAALQLLLRRYDRRTAWEQMERQRQGSAKQAPAKPQQRRIAAPQRSFVDSW